MGTEGKRRLRLGVLEALLLVWAAAVLARLFCLQVLDYHWLERKAERQQSRTIAVEGHRGAIYDRNLHPLAMSLDVDSVFAVGSQVADRRTAATALARILRLDARELAGRMAADRGFCWIARKITAEQSRRIRALHLAGIYFQKESQRFYPKGTLAAQALGYVGMDGNGLGGLELEFNRELDGAPGREVVEVDAHGQAYNQVEQPPEWGEALVLTLDQNIQYIAQQELAREMAASGARRGTVIVEDPANGEILALANAPTFNPNDYRTAPPAAMTDAAISDVYEPGSTFKLVTLSAALDDGLARPDEEIDCQEGSIWVGGRLIHDHAAYGLLTVSQVLVHSSDVGAIKIGLRLGDDRLYHYIRAYGFGQPTGIELPGESWGLARPPDRWTKMSIGAISMGQEIAVTPLQVIAMVSTLADGGIYHAPHLILDRLTGDTPPSDAILGATESPAAPGRRVVGVETANEMKAMMEQVVLEGTGRDAQLAGYTAGGKTGTAQKVDAGARAYSRHDYVASFVGFAPLRDPAVAILVVLDSPRGSHEGGEVAAPAFRRIAERVLPYLGVPHDIPLPAAPLLRAERQAPATALSDESPLVADAVPATGNDPPTRSGMVVEDYDGGVEVPDFAGKSLRQVAETCQRLGLEPVLEGDGVARQQQPAAHQQVVPGARVIVWFQP